MSGGMWYWARRRLTLAGWGAATAVVMTAAVGTDFENTVTYQTFALLFVLMVFAFLCSFWFPGKFSATRRLPASARLERQACWRPDSAPLNMRPAERLELYAPTAASPLIWSMAARVDG